MVALYFMYYNFGRVHQTLRVTPAMEAGVANHVWSVEEVVALLDSNESDITEPIRGRALERAVRCGACGDADAGI